MTKQQAIKLLKEKYLSNMKEDSELFVGVELEFPIVEINGNKTNIEVTKNLFRTLANLLDFKVEKMDDDQNPIQLVHCSSKDRILFELSYNTIEFAFEKAHSIDEVAERFEAYLKIIQPILQEDHHEIQGHGIHPQWQKNDNSPVKIERYKMLMAFLAMNGTGMKTHPYPSYGAFICGNQLQLDVRRDNYIRIINAFNKIEAAKAYLFSNSEFSAEAWDTKITRDIFWEESLHGYYKENVGIYPKDYQSEEEFFNNLARTAIFTAARDDQSYYFKPIRVKDYLDQKEITAYTADGNEKIIKPVKEDLKQHRSYQFQDLTARGTVEFRSVCTQPLETTFAPIAFELGLFVQLENLENYLEHCSFLKNEKQDYRKLRKKYSKKILSEKEEETIQSFSKDLIDMARAGLIKRGYGEETFLIINKELNG
ncbi:glutamate-cysteine ligase family protein [Streptococcus parasanguinis]|jgi:gamma-glutamylcysteine synthetase|uniref:glutamate--cysteine ligase n=1 Tax=Streptococcus gingivalis TaxID=3111861 RepID=A0ABU6BA83_9STRE|nr:MULTISPECIES: glutamate-cysteine ligase family protein [Streptococcus]MDB8628634.1 glutamate-cysteine ligase family protein [Streptococcus parasanguinis]MDU2420338.1 glutamate-cysteine ligase family protein [Streptococcus parasanguinis]MDU2684308.1 glutamate-cysteine ligase family protein [Streptococcus parasanguinis]MEB3520560.1 glutamate-cysteine ligase family protein [Streptococcus sp. S2(2023)]